MKLFDVNNIKLGLSLVYTPEQLAHMKTALKIQDLAGLHCDIWNLYKVLVAKHGVCNYTEARINGYLSDIYDQLQPDCTFDDFRTVLYFQTDGNGNPKLPSIEDAE